MKSPLTVLAILVVQTVQIKTHQDVRYYEGADSHPRKHLLDLYLPADAKSFPMAVFVHGGTWMRGGKDAAGGAYAWLGRKLAERGLGVAVINYRLSPEVRHPEHARDVARAVAWVYAHCREYGGDPNALFLIGHSAGGHLCSLVAVDPRYLEEEKLRPHIIRGVISLSGVYDLTLTGVAGQFIYEPVFTSDPEKLRGASPALQVKVNPSPFLLLYAERDYLSADFQARRFQKALQSRGGEASIQLIPERNHVNIAAGLIEEEDPVQKAVMKFIEALAP